GRPRAAAGQEAREGVESGISPPQLEWPVARGIAVTRAPAALRKEGSGFDLPIALAILAATRQIELDALKQHAAIGELALDGRVRPVGGVMAAAEGARKAGLTRLLCPAQSAPEAELAGVEAVPLKHIGGAGAYPPGECG